MLDIVQRLGRVVTSVRPGIVHTHHANDLNVERRMVHEAVLAACRLVNALPVRAIYASETPSSMEWETHGQGRNFVPTRFVDITAHIGQKLNALSAYDKEMRLVSRLHSAEGIEGLSTARGAQASIARVDALDVARELV